jgi:hypothetical protein
MINLLPNRETGSGVSNRAQIDHQLLSNLADSRFRDIRQKMLDQFGLAGLAKGESVKSESLEQCRQLRSVTTEWVERDDSHACLPSAENSYH